jgi:hypothetical protein
MNSPNPAAPIAAIAQASSMRGFAAEFKNLDHYIRVITDRIWEGRRLEDIRIYYSDPCIVETPSSVSTSVQAVIDGTKATLAMFPDRRLLAEDVIQSGDDQGGFLSSHRIISPMTHAGDGSFGPATGRKLHVRTIADCVCKDNRITHEWLVRDQAAIALQVGSTPRTLAQKFITERGWTKSTAGPAPSYYSSNISQHALAQSYAQAIESWSQGKSPIAKAYDDAAHHIGPGNTTRFGHVEIDAFWTQLFSAFKVKHFTVEHLALQTGDGRADRVALRWRAQCEAQSAAFACSAVDQNAAGFKPGAAVEIMGINHVEFNRGRVLREFVLIDEVALWMQILSSAATLKN